MRTNTDFESRMSKKIGHKIEKYSVSYFTTQRGALFTNYEDAILNQFYDDLYPLTVCSWSGWGEIKSIFCLQNCQELHDLVEHYQLDLIIPKDLDIIIVKRVNRNWDHAQPDFGLRLVPLLKLMNDNDLISYLKDMQDELKIKGNEILLLSRKIKEVEELAKAQRLADRNSVISK